MPTRRNRPFDILGSEREGPKNPLHHELRDDSLDILLESLGYAPSSIGKARYFLKAVRIRDYATAARYMEGIDINYRDSQTGGTALHFVAARRAIPFLRKLEECADLDYLVKDNKGRYPSELAWTIARDAELGEYLQEKEAQAARQRGITAWPKQPPSP